MSSKKPEVNNVSQRCRKRTASAIGNMHKKINKDHTCDSGDILTDRHTDILITIRRNCSQWRSDKLILH